MRKTATALLVGAVLTGCASHSGIVPMGNGTYMVSEQAATGFSGLSDLKATALRQASEYCTSQSMTLKVTNTTESQPPYILGNYPRSEVQFTCVKP